MPSLDQKQITLLGRTYLIFFLLLGLTVLIPMIPKPHHQHGQGSYLTTYP